MDKKIPPLAKPMELISKYRFVLLIAAVGILLMLMPSFGGEKDKMPALRSCKMLRTFQWNRHRKSLRKSFIRYRRCGACARYADGSLRHTARVSKRPGDLYSGPASTPEDYTSTTQTVLLDRSGSGDEALQTQELYPPYGALVVCDGAGNSGTVLKVKEAVSVLTGLEAIAFPLPDGRNLKIFI